MEFLAAFHEIGDSETVHKCREMKKDKEVKTLQNGSKQELQSCTDSGIHHNVMCVMHIYVCVLGGWGGE